MAHNNSTAAPPLLPPGIPADTSHLPHDNQQGNLIAACIITWLISAVMVCARFYTRSTITRTMGSSDWFIFASMVRNLSSHPTGIEGANGRLSLTL